MSMLPLLELSSSAIQRCIAEDEMVGLAHLLCNQVRIPRRSAALLSLAQVPKEYGL
jgi:hypothetical protein